VECLEGRALLSSSSLVHPDASGHLVYVPDAQGNIIPDFSNVGYQGGIVPLPGEGGTLDVPVRATVKPQPGPADARIQAAINFVSRLPAVATGFRGAERRERHGEPGRHRAPGPGVSVRGPMVTMVYRHQRLGRVAWHRECRRIPRSMWPE